ncbi:MAG: hypothetical protein DCC43_14085 [Candidatus Brocadia sp.]|uniref:Uncharacterized protein n=1 Tax=Candidatus Brocadia fulgida TaxID=380242 RepID=A0A0M2UT41_9BACT|nr:MAG: hypothetical protein BROFUL_03159 [Candidatus Brocadia fulgida]MCC6326521.1 YdbH domain-containing protein [Candidatus Brocadia sp.]MCE7912873.1 hypothetical protein [Candidatus Brocadia sp. AMX3]MDG5998148.1 hypothetical protein [Candidatus Brocadia sp.]RIJ91788.1 MAG: hypothetical protein DCC43_14085 [Candidatus Brocadia sp.]
MKLIRKALLYSVVAAFIGVFLASIAYVCVPIFLEKILLPRLVKSIGFANSTGEVRKFGLTRLDMASLRWGELKNPFLLLDSVRVDYSLPGLLKKHIKKIIVSGVEIRAEYKDGSFVFPGVDFGNIFQSPAETKSENPDVSYQEWLPISFDEFEIRNATMILTSGNTDFRIPFSIKAMPIPGDKKYNLTGYTMQAEINMNFNDSQTALNAASRADIHSTVNFQSNEISMRFTFPDLNLTYQGYQLRNSPGNTPLSIEMRKKQDALHVNFSRFCIPSPFPVEISMDRNTDWRIRFTQKGMDAQGVLYINFQNEIPDAASDFGLKISDPELIPIKFRGQKQGNTWNFSLNSLRLKKPLKFLRQRESISLYPERFSCRGKGSASQGGVRFALKMSDIAYDSDALQMSSPNMLIYGNTRIQSSRSPLIKAFMKLTDAEVKSGGFSAEKIDAEMPFQWPYPSDEKDLAESNDKEKRYFTIDRVKYYDMDIGTIASTLYQDGMGIRFTGQYAEVLPSFHLDFSGRAGITDAGDFVTNIDFQTPEPEVITKIDLGKFSSQLTNIYFDGNIGMSGSCQVTGSTVTSNAVLSTHNAKIEIPGKQMALEGIDLDLKLRDLYQFYSAPDQVLKFKRFAWGDIELNEGEVLFQIESLSSFFLKKSSFSWCGGHVYTHGSQITSGKREIDIICYCDRLKLATLLKQFNAASAEGGGEMNGRIPINYKDGKLKIHDGFLYSTPGEGGTIRFHTDTLIPGASGVQQSIQMQIAQEALKNFTYDWARLSLMSQDEDLVIRMQMDGRPAGPLPFGYSKNAGLVKIEQPRASFQGILFHINFKLPLDKMLYYGSGFSGFLQNK